MPVSHGFSTRSKSKLRGCDPRIVMLFEHVVIDFDCSILCGRRGAAAQQEAFDSGHSKAKYGQSPHNTEPLSMAVDAAPYPIDWNDRDRFIYFGGFVLGVAKEMDVPIVWGGDWNSNRDLSDQTFDDLVHFEIRNWRNNK
jgi:hypothetical protein